MWNLLKSICGYRKIRTPNIVREPRLILTEASISALKRCIAPEISKEHEGVSYLLGRALDETTLVVSAIRPDAETTSGSFSVGISAMAKVVRACSKHGLHVVGQVHTHPNGAYHSIGDIEGARIAYRGYVSIVLPDYGRLLPSLERSATYIFEQEEFCQLSSDEIAIVPGRLG